MFSIVPNEFGKSVVRIQGQKPVVQSFGSNCKATKFGLDCHQFEVGQEVVLELQLSVK
jgi:hypothetical protein